MPVLATRRNQSENETSQQDVECMKNRVAQLIHKKIDFILNASFEERNQAVAEKAIEIATNGKHHRNAPTDLPAHLKRMCEAELLTHEQEAILFREMNFMKFCADKLRSQLNMDSVDTLIASEIDQLLQNAERIRDHIINANMRLVISIVKKFVTPQKSFDEMLSDGIMILMQAVDKFDFDRGFRFSTYAYRSIARNAYRTITTAQKEEAKFTRDSEEWAFEQEDSGSSSTSDQIWSNIRELMGSMLKKLDRREQFIIRSRYALGAHRNAHTFQSMADKLGISKERVRQLEQRAVSKLQAMAGEFDADDLFGASMV